MTAVIDEYIDMMFCRDSVNWDGKKSGKNPEKQARDTRGLLVSGSATRGDMAARFHGLVRAVWCKAVCVARTLNK